MRLALLPVLACFAGCTTGASTVRHDWEAYGYARLSPSIDALIMIDGEAAQQWNNVCESITVHPRTLVIDGEGCVEKSYGALDGQ